MDIRVIFRTLLFCVWSLVVITSCGGDNKDESDPFTDNGKVYAQTMFLPAENANNVIVVFRDLKNEIKEMGGGAEWLMVIKQNYTSGSPAISLTATDNMKDGISTDARNCTLTVKAVNGDQVVLTVIQEGHQYEAPKTGIDDSHNTPTDQPAYSRFQ